MVEINNFESSNQQSDRSRLNEVEVARIPSLNAWEWLERLSALLGIGQALQSDSAYRDLNSDVRNEVNSTLRGLKQMYQENQQILQDLNRNPGNADLRRQLETSRDVTARLNGRLADVLQNAMPQLIAKGSSTVTQVQAIIDSARRLSNPRNLDPYNLPPQSSLENPTQSQQASSYNYDKDAEAIVISLLRDGVDFPTALNQQITENPELKEALLNEPSAVEQLAEKVVTTQQAVQQMLEQPEQAQVELA